MPKRPKPKTSARSKAPAKQADGKKAPRSTARISEDLWLGCFTTDEPGDIDYAGSFQVIVEAGNLPEGPHGTHIHAVGKCTAPDFASAGPHWNPAGRQHGRLNPPGPHLGDLPNLEVRENGTGRVDFDLPVPTGTPADANPLLDADGTAIVIHAAADDERTDPAGNSGARIACGAFAPAS